MRFVSDAAAALPFLAVAFAAAAVLAFVLTPLVRRRAIRYGVVDRPNHRRVNKRPIPRSGGLAIASGFLTVSVVLVLLNIQFRFIRLPLFLESGEVVALLAGAAAAAAIGALDDFLGITSMNNPFGPGVLRFEGLLAVAITVLWIVGMINSVNFIDGLDGLSSGIGLIAALTLGVISLTTTVGQPFVALLCFALAGSLLGFLRWNFHPASIFPGTSGTMFIGYTLAVLSILGSAKVAVALLVLGVPIIDAFWIIVRRLFARRSPFTPDRGHIHHRLLDLGLSHRQAVSLIYAICGALGVLSLILTGAQPIYAFLGVFVGTGLLLLLLAWGGDRALEAEAYEREPHGDASL